MTRFFEFFDAIPRSSPGPRAAPYKQSLFSQKFSASMATDASWQPMATDTENGSFRALQACALPPNALQVAFDRMATRSKRNPAGIVVPDAVNSKPNQ